MKESRLIGYKASDFQKQLRKSTTVARPTGTTTTSGQSGRSAAQQQTAYQSQTLAQSLQSQAAKDAAATKLRLKTDTTLSDTQRAGLQNQVSMLERGVAAPTKGLQGGSLELLNLEKFTNEAGEYDLSLAEAQAEQERIAMGTVTPETQSAIDLLTNPELFGKLKTAQNASSLYGGATNVAEMVSAQADRGLSPAITTSGAMGKAGAFGFNEEQMRVVRGEGLDASGLTQAQQEDIDRFSKGEGIGYTPSPEAVEQKRQALAEGNERLRETYKKKQEQRKESIELQQKPTTPQGATTVSGFDLGAFDSTSSSITSIINSIKGLDPSIATAIMPSILSRLNAADEVKRSAKDIIDSFQTDEEIEAGYAGLEDRAIENERKWNARIKENQDILIEAENINKQALELDKQMMQHKAAEAEQAQIKANVQNERKMRRQLNALGIETDVKGIEYLNNAIEEGETLLRNIRENASLMTMKYDLEIGQRYANNVKSILSDAEAKYLEIQNKTDDRLDAIQESVSLAKSERDKEIRNTLKWEAEQKNKYDIEIGDKIYDAQKESNSLMIENRRLEAEGLITTGDSLKMIQNISSRIEGNKFIAEARAVDTRFRGIDSVLNEFLAADASGDNTRKVAAEQAIVSMFNKITDPASVVRESEYARSSAGQSSLRRLESLWVKVVEGGDLTKETLVDLRDTAKVLNDAYKDQLTRDLQPYLNEIKIFNSQPNVTTPIRLEDVIPSNLIPQVDAAQRELWRSQLFGSGMDSFTTQLGWLSAENAPAGGYRTDRSNNPTAFTVDIAKQAGLVEGVDYIRGDRFNGGVTAKLLGDPFDLTRKVIDNIGFYTKSGGQRWTHTAIDKQEWDSLDIDQKNTVIVNMYQREGGTGVLAQGLTLQPVQVAATSPQVYSFAPTAQAADYNDGEDDIIISPEESIDEPLDTSLLTFEDLAKIREAPAENREQLKRAIIAKKQLESEQVSSGAEALGSALRKTGEAVNVGVRAIVEPFAQNAKSMLAANYRRMEEEAPKRREAAAKTRAGLIKGLTRQ